MIDAIEIKDFRGIRALTLEGLGRVNLLIGGNGCGKTTVAAACVMGDSPSTWIFVSYILHNPHTTFRTRDMSNALQMLRPGFDLARVPSLTVTRGEARTTTSCLSVEGKDLFRVGDTTVSANEARQAPYVPRGWVPAFVQTDASRARELVGAYKEGRTAQIVAAVQQLEPRLESIDVPGGEVFVRLRDHPLPMPANVLGDGALRAIDIACTIGERPSEGAGIDELENGFHHSSLPKIIAMLRNARSDQQIFATTHREELLVQACEQFIAHGDDSLRIIRIDQREGVHSAQVYTAEQALAGIDAGLEIRG